jgi:hypothetical protein
VRYITNPPSLRDNIPPFIKKRYGLFDDNFVENLFSWARKEYYDMIIYLYSIGDMETAKILESPQYSYIDFVSHSKTFESIISNMTSELWNSLERPTRDLLIKAREIYDKGK